MASNQDISIYDSRKVKLEEQRLRDTKFCMRLIASIVFVGTLCLSLAVGSLMNNFVIRSGGQVTALNVTAKSGSARDIQAAVDLIAANGGIGNVYIPEGTFNFIDINQTWQTVNVPAGVNIFGAPTNRYSNGSVISWKTILVMPYEVPSTKTYSEMLAWFRVQLGNQTRLFRFSDIELVGWRYFDYLQNGEPQWKIPFDPNDPGSRGSQTMYMGLMIYTSPYNTPYQTLGIQDFRVDHCNFQDMGGNAVWVGPKETVYNWHTISGVIDHNRLVNSYGDPGRIGSSDYQYRTLDYGISINRWASDLWDSNLGNIAGKYLDYSIFIEDNYFSKWRHAVTNHDGLHAVVRHNIFDGSYGVGDVDAHGSYATTGREYAVGSRFTEIYSNVFQNPRIGLWDPQAWCINIRGGAAIIFNNTLIGYTEFLDFNEEYGNIQYQNKCKVDNVFMWNNTLNGATPIWYDSRPLGGQYYLRAPNSAEDGFDYAAYPYPHPLTQQGSE